VSGSHDSEENFSWCFLLFFDSIPFMYASILALIAIAGFYLAYRFYSRFIGQALFELKDTESTPAHDLKDVVDYVPTSKWVLFGHHYSSVAGAAPIVGPAVAVIWGWLPALVWVILGS